MLHHYNVYKVVAVSQWADLGFEQGPWGVRAEKWQIQKIGNDSSRILKLILGPGVASIPGRLKDGLVHTVCACVNRPKNLGGRDRTPGPLSLGPGIEARPGGAPAPVSLRWIRPW